MESQVAFSIKYSFSVTSMHALIKLSYAPQVLCDLNTFGKEDINYMNTAAPNMTGAQLCLPMVLMVQTSGSPCSSLGSLYSALCAPQRSAVPRCMALQAQIPSLRSVSRQIEGYLLFKSEFYRVSLYYLVVSC